MSKYLLVVDVQREFVKDKTGEKVYQKCLDYIASAHNAGYTAVIAAVYKQSDNFVNMDRLLSWNDVKEPMALDFVPDAMFCHAGYSIKEYPSVTAVDMIDIIGFDTDACVLSAAFDVFNIGCNMRILSNLCWSSGGAKLHKAALMIMERQFGEALDTVTDIR